MEDASNSDSSADGDLGFDYQRRPIEPPQRSSKPSPARPAAAAPAKPALPRPTLVAADDSDDETLSAARSRPLAALDRASQTLAQRARQAAESGSSKRSRRAADEADSSAAADGDDIIRGTPGGGMEMSFVPQPKSAAEVAEKKKAQKDKREKDKSDKAKFGMGLERSRGGPQEDEQQRRLEDEEDSGRKRMRKPARSASRNKTRFL